MELVLETVLRWHRSWDLTTITGYYFCIQAYSLIRIPSLAIVHFLPEKALVAECTVGVIGCKKTTKHLRRVKIILCVIVIHCDQR